MSIDVALIDDFAFGARVSGLDFASLEREQTRVELRRLLADKGLLVIEDVTPDHRFQVALSEIFGAVKSYPPAECVQVDGHVIAGVGEMRSEPGRSTIVEIDGVPLAGWMPWHYDQCYNDQPNTARTLRCGRPVQSGGMTGFLDGRDLYRHFDPGLRDEIAKHEIVYGHNLSVADLRYGIPSGFKIVSTPMQRSARPAITNRSASHPAVRVCASGEPILHVSPWMATGLVGSAANDGDALLDAVAKEIARIADSFAFLHRWTTSDMVVWDNLRMLHSASGHDPAETRIMYRSTIHVDHKNI
jgi:taurine dioxygenase